MDPRNEKLARVLVEYSLEVQPGQVVAIQSAPIANELVLALYRTVLQAGAQPVGMLSVPGADEVLYKFGSDEQLSWISPMQRFAIEEADARIAILADTNTRSLSNVDPERQQLAQRARADLMQTFMRRSAEGELAWSVTLFPTDAYAQDADMSLSDYSDFVYGACRVDTDDPVAVWQGVSRDQQRLIDWLTHRNEIHIIAPDTDLRVQTGGRTWINADGKRNFPDGEIFTGPIEDSVEGTIRFSFPAINGGREVEDVQLWFEKGKVVKATAAKNQDFLERMLDMDEGARYVGEFAFGTNRGIDRFTKNILFDEKIGGTIHMAVGAGYPDSGSQNQSGLHWDMICDLRQGGEVHVDGELFQKDGEFAV